MVVAPCWLVDHSHEVDHVAEAVEDPLEARGEVHEVALAA